MYICYLDESGTREPKGNTGHFVLLGLAIPADEWKAADTQTVTIKGEYGLQDAEVHAAWMARDYPEQSRIPDFKDLPWEERRRAALGVRALNLARTRGRKQTSELIKNYRKTEPYVHLTRSERQACLDDLAKMLGRWTRARLFADAQNNKLTSGVPGFDFAFEQVVTRFNTFLARKGQSLGILVQDNNETVAGRLTEAMRRYHREGTVWRKLNQIVETPLFVDSALTSAIQLADLCAFATRRFFDNGEERLFGRFYSRFDRHRGKLVGLRHYTGAYACKCRVCIHHGRVVATAARSAV